MIALLLRALTMLALGAAIGIIYLAVADALVAPAVGLALIAAVVLVGCFAATAPLARRRLGLLERLQQGRQYKQSFADRLRTQAVLEGQKRRADPFDRKRWTREEIIRGADIDAIVAEDDAHNRLGL